MTRTASIIADGSGGVVGGAGRIGIGVEVRAHDHDFAGEVGAGDLRDDVERVAGRIGFGMELRLDVHFHPHRLAALDQADDAVVVLDGERRRRHLLRRLGVAAAAVAGEDRAAVDTLRLPRQVAAARRRIGVGAAIEHGGGAFGDEEPLHRLRELLRGRRRRARASPSHAAAAPAAPGPSSPRPSRCRSSAARCGRRALRTARGPCSTTILPCSWPLYLARSASLAGLHVHDIGQHRSVGRRRVPARLPNQRAGLRRRPCGPRNARSSSPARTGSARCGRSSAPTR